MPKPDGGWACEKCGQHYKTEYGARECEIRHPSFIGYDSVKNEKYVPGKIVPDEIVVVGYDRNRYVYEFRRSLGKV